MSQQPQLSEPPPSTTGTKRRKRPKVAPRASTTEQGGSTMMTTQTPIPPIPPADHDRCHVFLPTKKRFCRQSPVLEVRVPRCSPPAADEASRQGEESFRIARYCGNHRHVAHAVVGAADDDEDGKNKGSSEHGSTAPQTKKRMRVPCPLDNTHTVWADQIEKHIKKCPKLMRQANQQAMECYMHDHNRGGFGDSWFFAGSTSSDEVGSTPIAADNIDADCAAALARRVMRAYNSTSAREGGIPLADLATPALVEELQKGAEYYRIKTGGPKHMQQHTSLVGHLKRVVKDAFEEEPTRTASVEDRVGTDNDANTSAESSAQGVTVLEMGAGRGITGLLVAGAMKGTSSRRSSEATSPSSSKTVDLVLVDRGNSRSKADTVLRRATTIDPSPHLDLRLRSWRRVTCDLDHLHVPTLLDCSDMHSSKDKADEEGPSTGLTSHGEEGTTVSVGPSTFSHSVQAQQQPQAPHVVVIAKHLCGSGTDVALKSLVDVKERIRSCAFATCCHGLCTWDDYVGRNFLGRIMTNNEQETQATISSFGKREFDLLARWSAGTASFCSPTQPVVADESACVEELPTEHSSTCLIMDSDDPFNVAKIAAAIRVEPPELGRACQRLIDFGRREFIQSQIFTDNADDESPAASSSLVPAVELVHYVPPEVTPQNALLLGWRQERVLLTSQRA